MTAKKKGPRFFWSKDLFGIFEEEKASKTASVKKPSKASAAKSKKKKPLTKSQMAALEPIALEETPTISSSGEPLTGFERIFCTKCWKMFVVVAGQSAPCLCHPQPVTKCPRAFISRHTQKAITTPLLRAQMTEVKERLMKAQPSKWMWLMEFYRAEYGPTVEPLLQEMQKLTFTRIRKLRKLKASVKKSAAGKSNVRPTERKKA